MSLRTVSDMNDKIRYYIGIDLGGTNTRAVLIDSKNRTLRLRKEKTEPSKDPERVATQIARLLKSLCHSRDIEQNLAGCCIGLAGLLSRDGRGVKIGPNLGWRDVPFLQLLARHTDIPTRIVNDMTAVAYGEFLMGAGRGSKNMFCVYVGSGIGSALLINGRPYDGSSNVAGELGHIKIKNGGRRCGCGSYGCLEAYTGGNAVRERIMEIARQDKNSLFYSSVSGKLERLNYSYVESGYKKNDPTARLLWEEIRDNLSIAIANVVTLLNPDTLVLGGGALSHTPKLMKAIINEIRRYATPPSADILKIREAHLGDDAGMFGAALLAKKKVEDNLYPTLQ